MANSVVSNYTRAALITYLNSLATLYLGVGTGAATALPGDTTLTQELTTAVLGATYLRPGPITDKTITNTTVTGDTMQWGPGPTTTWTSPIGAGITPSITEAGIFSAVTVGNMYYKTVFAAMNIAPGFGIQVQASIVAA